MAIKASEHQEQAALFDWVKWNLVRYPDLEYLYSIPNGGKLPYRKGLSKAGKVISISPERTKLIKEGLKTGVSDLFFSVARGDYHGLYLELKAGDNEPTKEQYLWLRGALGRGYYADWCVGWEVAKGILLWYLGLEE